MRCVPRAAFVAITLVIFAAAVEAVPMLFVVHGGATAGATAGGEIGTVDLVAGTYTPLGTPIVGVSMTGLANGSGGLFATTNSHEWIEIDPLTGLLVGSALTLTGGGFDPLAGHRISDLAYDAVSSTMFAVGNDGVTDRLFTVDESTGILTLVGPLDGGSASFDAIAFAPDGTLYRHQANSGSAEIIDASNGATLSTLPGTIPGGALGLVFDPVSGLLLGSECCFGSDGSTGERIFSLDPLTGTAIELVDFDDGRRIQDLEFVTVIPEPSTASLLALGLCGLAARRRRSQPRPLSAARGSMLPGLPRGRHGSEMPFIE